MAENCFYDVLQNDTYGRYAVASKDLKPGDLIITELPFTYGPKSDSAPVCLGCHCGIDGLTMCSACGWPVCNEICEKNPIHSKNECGIFSNAKIKFTPVKDLAQNSPQYECIMPLRVLLTKERNEDVWEREIKCMESHCQKRKNTVFWEVEEVNVVGFLHKVCKLQRFSCELIHFVCGILEVNAFTAPANLGYEVRCLYPKASLFSHSCVPNIGHYIFQKSDNEENYRLYVRAMVTIDKGKELLLTYTQTMSPTYFRRAHLREGKYFDCSCERCADPTELGTNLSTLKCENFDCNDGWVMSTNPLDETALWQCTNCNVTVKPEAIILKLCCIQEEAMELQFIENNNPIATRENFIKKYSRILHPNHAIIMSVKSALSQLYGKAQGFLLKNLSDKSLERKIQLCEEIDEISKKIKPGISRQRGWNLYELHAPIILLAQNQLQLRGINEQQVRGYFETAANYLKEIEVIFSYEDPHSPEGITGKRVKQILNDLHSSILTLSE